MAHLEKIKLGISSCLLGENVRYDGGHKLDLFLKDTLGKYVEYVPVCPEFECGLGVPREAMRLEGNPGAPRLMTILTRQDLTERVVHWAHNRLAKLQKDNLRGFIFKSNSPSCGMEQVKVYNENGIPVGVGVGIFAEIFQENFPLLPVADEGTLHNSNLQDNFLDKQSFINDDKNQLDNQLFAVLRKFLIERIR